MKNQIFNLNPRPKIQKSTFDMSHEKKMTSSMGKLVPIFCQEVIPGDKFKVDSEVMIRFAPMVAPIMHHIDAFVHYFYVPNRIISDLWEDFITGKDSEIPQMSLVGQVKSGSVADMLGIPVGNYEAGELINDLPFRAYWQIFKDYYIDQNLHILQDIPMFDMGFDEFTTRYIDENGVNPWFDINPFLRSWEKDYFTSALPWAQKGEPASALAEIAYKRVDAHLDSGSMTSMANVKIKSGGTESDLTVEGSTGHVLYLENLNSITTDVEEIRRAVKLQTWLERNARAGSRYVEQLLSHFGVKSSDARLQRAEYLGGGKTPVVISEVLNHTGTVDLPQGTMSGHGISLGKTNTAFKYAEEHGFIIGLLSVMPKPAYQQGIHRMWWRSDKFDFYFPEFATLGEQEVKNRELYFSDDANDNLEFGYQSRYAEYKYAPNTVHGEFRSTLDFWHAGRKFASRPGLTLEFIQCNTQDINDRIFAVTGQFMDHLYIHAYNKVIATRPMPYFVKPSL